jgi:hypothetical protein
MLFRGENITEKRKCQKERKGKEKEKMGEKR